MRERFVSAAARERLRVMLEEVESPAGRRFAIFVQLLIFLSLIAVFIETFRNLPRWLDVALSAFEWMVILIFTAEYLARLFTARRPLAYAFSFMGLVDLAVIAPFWLLGADVRALRALLLLRLLKLLKLHRYTRPLRHFATAWRLVREDIIVFSVMVALLLYLAALGIWHFEHAAQPDKYANAFDALWWSVITITTVGYGDMYPVTVGGRILTMLVVLIGLGLVAVPSGLLASAFQEIRRRETRRGRDEDDPPPEKS